MLLAYEHFSLDLNFVLLLHDQSFCLAAVKMHANVEFLAPLAKYTDEKPFAVFPLAGTEELVTGNIELESKLVDLHDIRLANLNLAENGVELHRHLSQNIRPRTNFEMEHYKDEISEFLRGKIPDNVHITTYECVVSQV